MTTHAMPCSRLGSPLRKFSAAFPLLHLSSSQLLASMICLFSFVKERPHKADCKGSREFYRVKSAAED